MYLVTADEMQRMDRRTIDDVGIPGRVLMENAGRGATTFFLESLYRHHPGAVGILAGRGNNGGDGFVMARYLHQLGIPVTVILLAARERVGGDAAANLKLLDTMGVTVKEAPDPAAFEGVQAHWTHMPTWIDAILGTGLTSEVRGYFKAVIDWVNGRHRPVFAVDVPSGLNADTGQICGTCIQAAATATFAFAKVGHLVYPGRTMTGRLKVIEIGIPPRVSAEVGCRQRIITPESIKSALPRRQATAHKGTTGHLLVLAGSPGKTGAAAMAAISALRVGAGLVTLGVPASLNPIVESLVVEAMTVGLAEDADQTLSESAFEAVAALMEDKRCLAVGPGLGTNASTGRLLHRIIEYCPVPMVIDADALNLIAANPAVLEMAKAPLVLTPHPGEMARLTGWSTAAVQRDRIGCARDFARRHGVYLVLKGAATLVASPDGTVFINTTGNPGMAAGGMGDVLTGLIAGLITQGMAAAPAAHAGVHLHGMAADRQARRKAAVGYLATEAMHALPEALQDLLSGEHRLEWPTFDPLTRVSPSPP